MCSPARAGRQERTKERGKCGVLTWQYGHARKYPRGVFRGAPLSLA